MALDRSPEPRLAMKVMASVEWETPFKKVFLVLAQVAILFRGAKPF